MEHKGHASTMDEVHGKARGGVWRMSDDDITERVIRDLEKMNLIDPKTVNYKRVVMFPYGYPVYDLDYRKNVTELRDSVKKSGIHLLGRFAQFDYINSDVCVERAIALANEIS